MGKKTSFQFNFAPIVRRISVAAREAKGREYREFYAPKDALRDYIPKFFNADDGSGVLDIVMKNRMPSGQKLSGRYKRYAQPGQNKCPRHFETYPLTEDELKSASEIYFREPALITGIAWMQAAVAHYFSSLDEYIKKKGIYIYMAAGDIHGYKAETEKDSFLYDFLPMIAHSMARDGWKTGEDLTANMCQRGLATAFHKQAFSVTLSQDGKVHSCPFRKILASIYSMVLEKGDDGVVRIRDEEIPGALPAFAAKLWQERNPQINPISYIPPEVIWK